MTGDRGGGEPERSPWAEAAFAAALFACDPIGLGGVAVCARAGPVRDRWLELLRALLPPDAPFRKLPLHAGDRRLFGGIDTAATLSAGRLVAERGLLADADAGILIVASAERMPAYLAAQLGAVLDLREIRIEREGLSGRVPARFGVVALDESEGDEPGPSPALLDRLALRVDLDSVRWAEVTPPEYGFDHIRDACSRLPAVTLSGMCLEGLCAASVALGIVSLRAPVFAAHAARASAALAGRDEVSPEDAALAAMFVLAPRATVAPEPMQDGAQENGPENQSANGRDRDEDRDGTPDVDALTDTILAAARAALPPQLLTHGAVKPKRIAPNAASGKAGAEYISKGRGRPAGTRRWDRRSGGRLDIVETLRAAAPWQTLRRAAQPGGMAEGAGAIRVMPDDFRVRRVKARTQTATIFAVDASGSTALQRLAEAKGAVELLLAECYIRRDQVALVVFRGRSADVLLSPTRSLVRAKRGLANLAGGGGTPLASGIDAATALAEGVRKRGCSPFVVLLTDGRANVCRDGGSGRAQAREEALAACRLLRARAIPAVVVDTSPRPRPEAQEIAAGMGAKYIALPYADASALLFAAKAG